MRTQADGIELKANGKYSVKFVSYRGEAGDEYVSSAIESGAVFETEEQAYAGQQRALTVLKETGRYPNMCQPF